MFAVRQLKNNLDKHGRSVFNANEANTSFFSQIDFLKLKGAKHLDKQKKGATQNQNNPNPEGANNINFTVNFLTFTSIL